MTRYYRVSRLLGLVGGLVLLLHGVARSSPPSQAEAAAIIAGEHLSVDEIDEYLGRDAFELKRQLYELRSQVLQGLIDRRLLASEASKAGMSVEHLLALKSKNQATVSSVEADLEWIRNRDALRPLGPIIGRFQIVRKLETERISDSFREYMDTLRNASDVQILLGPPRPPAPKPKQSTDNPVELVVFQDYQCPFCEQLHEIIREFETQHNTSVERRHLPLASHPFAFDAALGAVCAEEQDSLTRFDAALFDVKPSSIHQMLEIARSIGLDEGAFGSCIESPSAREAVLVDLYEAGRLGLEGTPTLFIAGNRVVNLPTTLAALEDLVREMTASTK